MVHSKLLRVAFLAVVVSASSAQKQADMAACAACHTEAITQPQTPMGRALQLPGQDLILREHPILRVHKGAYDYMVQTHGKDSTYTVTDGTRTISVPLNWNFGVHNQTWILQWNGNFYESMISYYASIGGLDTTTGDEQIAPKDIEQAFGRRISVHDAKACFGCHTTNSVSGVDLDLATLHPGLACEHCHQGTEQHLQDISDGLVTSIPQPLGKLTAGQQGNFCGQCHRTWEMAVRSHWHGEMTVRFQPYRLEISKCFNANDPRIGCLACHDPHLPLSHDLAFYDDKCLACHAPPNDTTARHRAGTASLPMAKACPKATSNCVSCHMPRTRMLGGHLVFTDHDIRIVRPGDAYPN